MSRSPSWRRNRPRGSPAASAAAPAEKLPRRPRSRASAISWTRWPTWPRQAPAYRRQRAAGVEPGQAAVAGPGITKGDLFRHYLDVAPFLLPVARSPAGDAPPARRRRRPRLLPAPRARRAPPGVRRQGIPDDDVPIRIVGGNLTTLLYMVHWRSSRRTLVLARPSPQAADFVAIDLVPDGGRAVRARARRRALGARRAGAAGRRRPPQDVGRDRSSHLSGDAPGHVVRGGPAVLPA